jgi:SAM-dependent MidA family methyltransferase
MTLAPVHELPTPDLVAQAHSAKLVAEITREIGDASISFARYMHLALYAPALGYYMAGQQRFGEGGDFTTAPEMSPVFARCVANTVASVFTQLGHGDVLELGAGSGALACGLLQHLAATDRLPRRYSIVELSPDLKRTQERYLRKALAPRLLGRVSWLSRLPESFSGVVIANEVADALPVTRFRVERDHIAEVRTACARGEVHDRVVPASDELAARVDALQSELGFRLPREYCSELSLELPAWVSALAGALHEGALLVVDYGYPRREYYSAERHMGTLLCHYRHRVHDDPYWYPGLQDISASVDFTSVAEAATQAGLELEGYTNQAGFLIDTGLLDELPAVQGVAPRQITARQQLHVLLSPGEMGERFGVIGLSRGLHDPLPGFQFRSLTHRL